MKPSELRPRQEIQVVLNFRARDAVFVQRCPAPEYRRTVNILKVPEFAGLNGPYDEGICQMSDSELSRKLTGF